MTVFVFYPDEATESTLVSWLNATLGEHNLQQSHGLNGYSFVWFVGDDGAIELLAVEEPRLRVLFLDLPDPEPWVADLQNVVDEMPLVDVIEAARKGEGRIGFCRIASFLAPDDPAVMQLVADELNAPDSWRRVGAVQSAEYLGEPGLMQQVQDLDVGDDLALRSSIDRVLANRNDAPEFFSRRVGVDITKGPRDVVNALQDALTTISFRLGVTFKLVERIENEDLTKLAWDGANNELIRVIYHGQKAPMAVWVDVISTSDSQTRLLEDEVLALPEFVTADEALSQGEAPNFEWVSGIAALKSAPQDRVLALVKQALAEGNTRQRIDAAWAASAIGSPAAITALEEAARDEENDNVLAAIRHFLGAES